METLDLIVKKYNIDLSKPSPFIIPCCRVNDFPALCKELGFTVGVELGVCDGLYSEVLCRSNPELKLFSVDMWQEYPIYRNFRRQRHYDAIYQSAIKRLEPYPNDTIVKKWSMDAVKDFPDESLDFIFIDANHDFEHVTEDIAQWGKKIRKGGIISGHDFKNSRRSLFVSVETVVRAWTQAKRIHPWFIMVSTAEPKILSWMWVKQ
ncbi:MAG: class I SAM-dependent methyltransferase [Candidatus Paceibacterota bacterium]|jgi:hypothetical protein|nr:class I SAM-dependent methyltransferase [Candidatus Paceibacterota bacterium]